LVKERKYIKGTSVRITESISSSLSDALMHHHSEKKRGGSGGK
jgi:hypothetical protein